MFVCWKNLNGFSFRDQRKHYLRDLNDAINKLHVELSALWKPMWFELTTDEVEIPNLALKHGLLLRPKEPELMAVIEDVYDQICRHKLFTNHYFAKHRIQTALKSFTYNYLNLDLLQFKLDQKKLEILRNLRERCTILKPNKGQGVVLVKKEDYYHLLERIFGKNQNSKTA